MEHDIKLLAEAITHTHTHDLVYSHVKALHFENNHLVIYVDNAATLHELSDTEADHHLQDGMEKVYGEDITYEIKIYKEHQMHDREKQVPHDINQ
jgi:hypothetical protein